MLNKDSKSFIVKRNELANIYDECDLLYLLIDLLLVLWLHRDQYHDCVLLDYGPPLNKRCLSSFLCLAGGLEIIVQVYQRALQLGLCQMCSPFVDRCKE